MPNEIPRSVLVIQTAFIGDVLLVIPLLKAVKQQFPETHLTAIVRPPADNLLESLPYLDDLIVYDKYHKNRGVLNFLALSRRLRREQYDWALIPHRSLRSGALALVAGIPIRVGFRRGGGRFFHTVTIPYPRNLHEIQRNLLLLSKLTDDIEPFAPEVVCTAEDIAAVNRLIPPLVDEKYIALAPGSVWKTKRWGKDHYAELGERLIQKGFRIILIGGKEDLRLCAEIGESIGGSCLNLAGRTTLRQSVEVLSRCLLLVSNDSAPTHLGAAAGIRVLTLFGPTVPEFGFSPFGAPGHSLGIDLDCRPCTHHGRQRCPERHFRCMRELSCDRVYDEIEEILGL